MSKRYELSIKATYLPNWTLWSAVRELLQNAKDAQIQYNATMEFKFCKRKRNGEDVGSIIISNKGCSLPIQSLLIGHTSKHEDPRMIGKWGEGLKFSCLTLVRMGMDVKIRNGSEVWIPIIAHSKQFNDAVLAFDVSSGHKNEDRVQIEVVGVTESQWKEIDARVLFNKAVNNIQCSSGEVLTAPEYKGKLFVKGMFVADSEYSYGFNLYDADIDRDRRMVNEASQKVSELLTEALNNGHVSKEVYSLLKNCSPETNSIYWRANEEAIELISKEFEEEYPSAIPVETEEQAKELEQLGSKGIKTSWSLRAVLERKTGKASDIIIKLKRSSAKEYSMDELSPEERAAFVRAISIVSSAASKSDVHIDASNFIITDFNDSSLDGTFDSEKKKIKLSKNILNNLAKTIVTMSDLLYLEDYHIKSRELNTEIIQSLLGGEE